MTRLVFSFCLAELKTRDGMLCCCVICRQSPQRVSLHGWMWKIGAHVAERCHAHFRKTASFGFVLLPKPYCIILKKPTAIYDIIKRNMCICSITS